MEIRVDRTTKLLLFLILLALVANLFVNLNSTKVSAQAAHPEIGRYRISAYANQFGSGYFMVDSATGKVTKHVETTTGNVTTRSR